MNNLKIGLKKETKIKVEPQMLASKQGSGTVAVFATPSMVAHMERTSVLCVQPYLEEGYTTVGIALNISHEAASPLGSVIEFSSELKEISSNNKILTFYVEARDCNGIIGRGTHKRAVINKEKFEAKAQKKNNL